MTPNRKNLDRWIRTSFCEYNTALEELYFAQTHRINVDGVGDRIKAALCQEGQALIAELVREGNTDEGFQDNFSLLGDVGFYMAACARHNITESVAGESAKLREASALAMQLGAGLGVAPRFTSSHLMTDNIAENGVYKSFTSLHDELLFIDYNTIGVLAFKRAADALMRIQTLGVSHPIALRLLQTAQHALEEVVTSNQELFEQLDDERFFYNVRPYYKPYKVGFNVYRGANAGDFAGINVIDLLLGLCMPNQGHYSQLLVDKFMYMMPTEQLILRDTMRQKSIMDGFLDVLDQSHQPWFQTNARAFMQVCDTHGASSSQHHNQLVDKYIAKMADKLPTESQSNLTASGPPLPVLLNGLEKLRDMRTAAKRDDVATRYDDMQRLKAAIV